ncbi:MAG: tetratricopeptide repeat protein [Polyangiaceae bacterium]|nr:tetratricopeptide repeat protein [Polyangiaceae bacterium]
MTKLAESRWPERVAQCIAALRGRSGLWGLLLVAVTAAAYAPSLGGGFLNYDDPWLITDNPFLQHPGGSSLWSIWFSFDKLDRYRLGAEYLPIRDTSMWLEANLHGLNPQALRLSNLLIYLGAVFCLRSLFHRLLPSFAAAEVATWVFALHPAHVESVAWIASRKDVLALLFVGAGLATYARAPGRWLSAAALTACALLSKSPAVVLVVLLLVVDLQLARVPHWKTIAAVGAVTAGLMVAHLVVGEMIGMRAEYPGGSALAALGVLGTFWLRYLALLAFPTALSIVHEFPLESAWSLTSVLGHLVILGWLAAGVYLWRRRRTGLALVSVLWFVAPLLPVSHVLFPLQNWIADRYLWLSVTAVSLLAGEAVSRLPRVPALAATSVGAVALAASTAWVAHRFSDSVLLFEAAAATSPESKTVTYQLAKAYQERGNEDTAIPLYEETLRRRGGSEKVALQATVNLANIHLRNRHPELALDVLTPAARKWPKEEKIVRRLAVALQRTGEPARARQVLRELRRRARSAAE